MTPGASALQTSRRKDRCPQCVLPQASWRSALSHNGVAGSVVQVRGYPAPDHTIAAPIRLSFAKLQAQVPHSCGHWPEDLGASNWRFSAQNPSYWNFGCPAAYTLSAFVADPLVLGRAPP